jgi:hypothetical protein
MDVKPQNNAHQSATAAHMPPHMMPKHGGRRGPASLVGRLLTLIVVVAIAIGAFLVYESKQPTAPDSSKYQAVFMTNGQVYFGKLTKLSSKYTELSKVYYLQVQQPVQPSTGAKTSSNSQVSLTKLGNELHGPTDRMHISNDQVLFWEDLKDNSTVMKAIKNYENK